MPQTMLAILAIAILGTFAMNQQRNRLYIEETVIKNEVATQALAVATDRLEEMGRMPFDQRTRSSSGGMVKITTVAQLTPVDSFNLDSPSDDLDDFNGVSVDTFRVTGNTQVWFRIKTLVQYASETDPDQAVSGRTRMKKATVWAWPMDTLGINGTSGIQVRDTVVLSQAYACGSWCAW